MNNPKISPFTLLDAYGADLPTPPTLTKEILAQAVRTETDFLLKIALGFTHNQEGARDLLQQTFLRAWQSRERFEGNRRDLRNWLARILTNLGINGYYRGRLESSCLKATEADSVVTPMNAHSFSLKMDRETLTNFDALLQALKPHVDDRVWNAMQTIHPHWCHLLILVDLLDYSYREAAKILGIQKTGTVMSRIFRARRSLRAQLMGTAKTYGFEAAA